MVHIENANSLNCLLCSVKKGSVLVTRMESITGYKNKHGQHRTGKMFMTAGNWKIHQKQKKGFSKLRKSDTEAGDQL